MKTVCYFIYKTNNVSNLIGGNSAHNSDTIYSYDANINGIKNI